MSGRGKGGKGLGKGGAKHHRNSKKKKNVEDKIHMAATQTQRAKIMCSMKQSESEVAQSCPTLCDPMDCSLPGSSVHGIFQARVLEWVAISFSRASSPPRD